MMIHARLLACRHFPSNNFIPRFWGKSVRSPDLNKRENIMVPVNQLLAATNFVSASNTVMDWSDHSFGLQSAQGISFCIFWLPGEDFFVFVLCAVPIPFGFNGFEIGGLPDVWSPHFRGYLSRPHAFDRASCSKVMLQSHAPTGHQRFRTFVASVSSTYGGLDNKKWMKSR